MRQRAWVAIVVLAVGLGLGAASEGLPGTRAWNLAAGLCLLAAIVLGISLLPWWGRFRPTMTPLRGLFAAPRKSERWCARCGTSTPRRGPCKLCAHTPASRAR